MYVTSSYIKVWLCHRLFQLLLLSSMEFGCCREHCQYTRLLILMSSTLVVISPSCGYHVKHPSANLTPFVSVHNPTLVGLGKLSICALMHRKAATRSLLDVYHTIKRMLRV